MSCEREHCMDGSSLHEGYDNLRNDEATYCTGCIELEEMKRCSFCNRHMHGPALELGDGRRSCVGCMGDSDSCGDLHACFEGALPPLEVRYPGSVEWKRCSSVEAWSDFVEKMYGQETEWVAYLDAASRRGSSAEALEVVRGAMRVALERMREGEDERLRAEKRCRRRELRVRLLRRMAILMLRMPPQDLDAAFPQSVLSVESSEAEALATALLARETLRGDFGADSIRDFAVLQNLLHQFRRSQD